MTSFFTALSVVFALLWVSGILVTFKLNQRSYVTVYELPDFIHIAGLVSVVYLLFG